MVRGTLIVAIVFASLAVAHAEDAWQPFKNADGVQYDKRPKTGTKFFEYRATFTVPKSPAELIDAIWTRLEALRGKQVAEREVVRRSDEELVLHDYIKTPVVSDRELTLMFEKKPGSIRYHQRNDLGPPPKAGRVLLPVVQGGWRIEADGTQSRVTYDCYSEPGGSVPAWMVRGAQQDQIIEDVKRLRALIR
jgi:hypothetical protein